MRDLLIVLVVFGSLPMILARPQVGIIMWFWLSMMNPHRLAWGYANQLRVALVVGLTTLFSWLISKDSKRPPGSALIYILAGFTLWTSLAALFSLHPETSIPKWVEIIKILLMTFVTTCIVQNRERIQQLVWVVAISIGAYGIKGGIFTIATGGHYRVWGPEDTFIGDNNALALALIMVLPLFNYLRSTTTVRWLRIGLLVSSILLFLSIMASYSRGAFTGLTVCGLFYLIKSRSRVLPFIVVAGLFGAGLYFAPAEWYERMQTIKTIDTDESARGRFQAWKFAYELALDHPFFGGGQLIGYDEALYRHYVPDLVRTQAAHSIYFEVLGETGFAGLAFFLALLGSAYATAGRVIKDARGHPQLAWARDLATMTQISLVGYASAGAFLSLGFFDLYFAIIAIIAATHYVTKQELLKLSGPVTNRIGVRRAYGYPVPQGSG